jgi:hypothetical protein
MYEVMWDTTVYNDKSLWPTDGSQPFVYSMGDGTGYGQHGDYLFGWKEGVLQKALDARCSGNNCKTLKTQAASVSTACAKKQAVKEPVEGCKYRTLHFSTLRLCTDLCELGLSELPGSLPVTYQ